MATIRSLLVSFRADTSQFGSALVRGERALTNFGRIAKRVTGAMNIGFGVITAASQGTEKSLIATANALALGFATGGPIGAGLTGLGLLIGNFIGDARKAAEAWKNSLKEIEQAGEAATKKLEAAVRAFGEAHGVSPAEQEIRDLGIAIGRLRDRRNAVFATGDTYTSAQVDLFAQLNAEVAAKENILRTLRQTAGIEKETAAFKAKQTDAEKERERLLALNEAHIKRVFAEWAVQEKHLAGFWDRVLTPSGVKLPLLQTRIDANFDERFDRIRDALEDTDAEEIAREREENDRAREQREREIEASLRRQREFAEDFVGVLADGTLETLSHLESAEDILRSMGDLLRRMFLNELFVKPLQATLAPLVQSIFPSFQIEKQVVLPAATVNAGIQTSGELQRNVNRVGSATLTLQQYRAR